MRYGLRTFLRFPALRFGYSSRLQHALIYTTFTYTHIVTPLPRTGLRYVAFTVAGHTPHVRVVQVYPVTYWPFAFTPATPTIYYRLVGLRLHYTRLYGYVRHYKLDVAALPALRFIYTFCIQHTATRTTLLRLPGCVTYTVCYTTTFITILVYDDTRCYVVPLDIHARWVAFAARVRLPRVTWILLKFASPHCGVYAVCTLPVQCVHSKPIVPHSPTPSITLLHYVLYLHLTLTPLLLYIILLR